MVLLSGLVSFIATIASMPWWSGAKAAEMAGMVDDGHDDPHHPKHFSVRMVPGYMVMLLLLQTGMMGTFVSLDMFLFYVFWEVMLLPMYFLIGIWGGPRKEYAAIKFFLYTLAGSVLMLLAIIGIYYNSRAGACSPTARCRRGHTFNLIELAAPGRRRPVPRRPPRSSGFAVHEDRLRRPLHRVRHQDPDVPVPHLVARRARRGADAGLRHPGRRAPEDGHLRHPPLQLPAPARRDRVGRRTRWRSSASSTSSTPRSSASAQKDLKKLIAYSSVSHMGFSLLGMAAMTPAGISGAVLNLFTHGIISPMLFLIVGVIYDRAHHREIEKFGGLASELPEYTAIMGLAFFASLGLPGLAGFISEFMVFSGSFPVFTTYTIISATERHHHRRLLPVGDPPDVPRQAQPGLQGLPGPQLARAALALPARAPSRSCSASTRRRSSGSSTRSLHALIQNIRPL